MTADIQLMLAKAIGQGMWTYVTEFMKLKGIYLEGTFDQGDGTFGGILHTPLMDVRITGEMIPKGSSSDNK